MTTFTFDYATFIVSYPAFSNAVKFPEATLQMYWNTATVYMSDSDTCSQLNGNARDTALNLLTAHLTALSVIIAKGQVPYLMQATSIDKISVTLTPPPVPTQFQWWLSLTPYGQQLLALLQVWSVGGFFIGGPPAIGAFSRGGLY